MRLTKVISTSIEKGKLIVKVLGLGSRDVQTVNNILPFGIDSNPNKNYRAIYSSTESLEDRILLGILFERALCAPGETRLYAENTGGEEVFSLHLKNDGTCELGGNTNYLTKYNELKTGFDQLLEDHNKLVDAFNQHMHATAAVGPPVIPTVIPDLIPAVASEADISDSKSDILKTI
jgi:hypothetical protein